MQTRGLLEGRPSKPKGTPLGHVAAVLVWVIRSVSAWPAQRCNWPGAPAVGPQQAYAPLMPTAVRAPFLISKRTRSEQAGATYAGWVFVEGSACPASLGGVESGTFQGGMVACPAGPSHRGRTVTTTAVHNIVKRCE